LSQGLFEGARALRTIRLKMIIRNPSIVDADQVYEIERLSFEHPFPKEVIFIQLFLHSDTSLVVEHNGRVIGYAIAARENGKLHLLNFAVHPSYRGKGLGKLLLDRIIKLAEKRGLKEVYLEVESDNEIAKALYKKMGFKEVKVLKGYYPWGKDAILMVRKLE